MKYSYIIPKRNALICSNEQVELQKQLAKHREKRRLQEQLRRLTRNEEKTSNITNNNNNSNNNAPPLRCGACGLVGHIRTNRICPMFIDSSFSPPIPPTLPAAPILPIQSIQTIPMQVFRQHVFYFIVYYFLQLIIISAAATTPYAANTIFSLPTSFSRTKVRDWHFYLIILLFLLPVWCMVLVHQPDKSNLKVD